jgi:hypothetical protein
MDDLDKALDALKVQIKKEIIDNYFAARCDLEEDHSALECKMADYRHNLANLSPLFMAFYAALGREAAIDRVMQVLSLKSRPFYGDFKQLSPVAREGLLKKYRRWAFTIWGRQLNMVLDIYRDLEARCRELKAQYDKVEIHLQILNEDIQKFNNSFDFGLIAAQVEAMEGGGAPICGGLLCGEREELSTRMRFQHKKLADEDLPSPPALPPVEAVKGQFKTILQAFPP